MKMGYTICYSILRFLFFFIHRFRQTGRENIPEGAVLLCANHTSLKDPVFLAFAAGLKWPMRFMAKDELIRIPILGAILKSAGVFGVKRGQADLKAIKTALTVLKDGGRLGIFPEGHRVGASEDSEAKNGAIMLAAKTGAALLPVYIPAEKKLFGLVEVVIGKPYYLEKIKGSSETYSVYAKELMQKIEVLKP
jgi:1-acyl-sn-glycerol-3-phosphate acyltransferase